ncbi:hypothetical protein X471_00003 [Bartonella bacilliformis str. Heidi Mejia]|nr:hypothetical protein X471_00003 [Bartonella bacilliformis str. Heidi Mejia]KEG18286.1 hypothetical protein H707_00943 [Bartonella bacilliformis Hosp800-02]KEG22396.1 hypothetical protein H708_00951 [Bartonella bacilliformis VAB9028]KEG24652.1 hypothetical protein H706_00953 [Bartonella bacilliformis CAR600-02]
MPKTRPPHLVKQITQYGKLYGMSVLAMAQDGEYVEPMERKNSSTTIKLRSLN